MIPTELDSLEELELEEHSTRTYKVNPTTRRIDGWVDGFEAMEQAVRKLLSTERFESPIYSGSYGVDLESMIGKDPVFVMTKLGPEIQDALAIDDRVLGVSDFEMFEIDRESLGVRFTVSTSEGEVQAQLVVGGEE